MIYVKADKWSYKPSPYLFNIKSISMHPLYSGWMSCLISFVQALSSNACMKLILFRCVSCVLEQTA